MGNYILEAKNITKLYTGVIALDNISIKIKKGSIHALVGENGAGKSTLIKILSGAVSPSEGKIILEDVTYSGFTPQQAIEKGIGVVYQEFNLIPQLTVAENIFFKKELTKGLFLNKKEMIQRAAKQIHELGFDIDPRQKVANLSVAYQQLVEIARILSSNAKIVIMDEPSAPLTNKEMINLYRTIRNLKEKGVTIIYISHRLEEIFEICDTLSVLRDGKHIITKDVKDINKSELIYYMVNREFSSRFPERNTCVGDTVLRVEGLCNRKLKNVSLELRKGEVLGIAGLVGSGRTELALALFGADPLITGSICINDKKETINNPSQAIKKRIGLVPENRKEQGILLNMSVENNIVFSSLMGISKGILLNLKKLRQIAESYIFKLSIKTPSRRQLMMHLSGGNQQKVVVAKWLSTNSEIIIFDEPTRGIDVGAKHEIYLLINELAMNGKSIIMISSEMNELIGMADRILVMYEGSISGKLDKAELEDKQVQAKIMNYASGYKN